MILKLRLIITVRSWVSSVIKDFTRPEYLNPVMDMWEFFNENPQYRLLKYEPVKGGVRVYYGLVS